MSPLTGILVGLALLVANAFFVGAEFALVSARRTQIEPKAQAGSKAARTTLRAMENVSLVMAAAQLGITAASLGLGAVAEPALAHLLEPLFHEFHVPDEMLHPVAFVIALTVVVYLHVVLGEMVPKNIALAGPDRAALLLGPPMMAVVTAFRPLIVGFNMIANGILRLLRVEPKDEVSSTFTRDEVAALVEESHGEGLLEEDAYGRLAGALGFTERTVAAVVLPLAGVTTVERGASGADVEEVCAATGFSRFPVRDSEAWIGYVHIKDVLETDESRRHRPVDDKWIRPFASVRADDVLHDALETLQRRGAHLARVVDESGELVGLITLEDVLEELVGEIRDAAHHDED